MNIGIVGGRNFQDYDLLKEKVVEFINGNHISVDALVSGGARGADTLAEKLAAEINVEMIVFKPDYEKHGKGATLARNTLIIEHSDVVFAFWNGKSRGTLDSITKAQKMEKELFIISY
ncbi:DUF2493 domain-containing protein [Chryseobacterium lacus]|uniref:DUF2493 domain-containing protein n=1 Tax=Chryseobacterium lacus TaxID=2058346 RepID=UPI000F87B4F2|nr:DUF2493 domain-containing protein [Chryseobacterium lacus]RST27616.1 DUF2493 domain-containing protein [Chryseobacterium lacus]